MSLEAYLAQLDFTPDPFQLQAFTSIESGHSVVVSAPTGSGKTLIAEAAVHRAFERGRRAFYTTPIKALSNQKYGDLAGVYGAERVGLLTGDNSINGEAPIVVMTTEVLRNMIYLQAPELARVETVVLDEVHYLQDPARGPVWEEIIIHAPPHIRLVCLSATIANAGELAGWVEERRGTTDLIVEEARPVPLESLYFVKDLWAEEPLKLLPTFVAGGRPNNAVTRLLQQQRGRRRRFVAPRRVDVLEHLRRSDMLPAIYFIFSRAGCDSAAASVATAGLRLVDEDERAAIREIVDRRTAHLPVGDLRALGFDLWMGRLEAGVAAHHAGMVPAFKEAVEEAFARGLIRMVFATETLALGINMPARTVVLESMTKFNGETHEMLQPGDYTQLTGRAGRRGIDERGYGICLYSRFLAFERVASIAAAGAHPLRSSFRPTYNMAANLVANYSREDAQRLLHSSFARYQRQSAVTSARESMAALESEVARLRREAVCDRGDVFEFLNRTGRPVPDAQRGILDLEAGDVLEQPSSGVRSVVLQRDRWRSSEPRLIVVNDAGKVRRFRVRDLEPGTLRRGRLRLPQPVRPKDRRFHHKLGRLLLGFEPEVEEVLGWTIAERAAAHPVGNCPDAAEHVRLAQKVLRLEKDLDRRRRRTSDDTSDLIEEFDSILQLLARRGYVDGWHLTDAGRQLRVVYNELDLLLTEVIRSGAFSELSAAEFAALASAFVYDPRGESGETGRPTARFAQSWQSVESVWRALSADEERQHLRPTRRPEPGYAATVHLWASGAALDEILDDETLTAGDFVRNLRQLLDLLRQLRDGFPSLAAQAREAIRCVDRGVVAAGGQE